MVQPRTDREHRQCRTCVESVVYSRGTGIVEHDRLWQCCRCGFAENHTLWDAACSYCAGLSNNQPLEDALLCQRPIDTTLELDSDLTDAYATSYVIFSPELLSNISRTRPMDDLTSEVHQNLLRFDRFLQSNEIGTMVPTNNYDDYEVAEATTSFGSYDTRAVSNTCNDYNISMAHDTQHATQCPSLQDVRHQGSHWSQSSSGDQTVALNTLDKEGSPSCFKDDSCYGSLLLDPTEEAPSRKRNHSEIGDLDSISVPTEEDPIKESTGKRKRLLDSSKPRLACPFYKHSPWRCKHTSCARPGFLGIHRLKQHLERDHLFHQCKRCGSTFRGATGAEALAVHNRLPDPCRWQANVPPIWAIDQAALDVLKCRKGVQGKSEEQRWREIYSLVIADASNSEQPTAYVDGTMAFGDDSIPHAASACTEQQAMENWSRELLRVLPGRLTSAIMSATHDNRLSNLWKSFARDHLYEILQDTLNEITSKLREESRDSLLIDDLSEEPEQSSLPSSFSSAYSTQDSSVEFFDFSQLEHE